MSRLDDTIQARSQKKTLLEQQGIDTSPYSFDKKCSVADCLQSKELVEISNDKIEHNKNTVQTAGRLVAVRPHGKVVFANLRDNTGKIQLIFRVQELGQEQLDLFNLIDVGDFVGVTGLIGKSKTGEISIVVQSFIYLGKALRAIPSSFNLATDKEVRFRQRYVDLMINDQARQVMDARWLVLREIRQFLQNQHGFIEVETPVLQELYGGTNAKPFITHMNALDHNYYLRVAPELYLKRLIVAGYEKIFEIARNFRNEGIDQTHQPEFTMIEWYEAYADYHKMMDVAEAMVKHLVRQLHGQTQIDILDSQVDFGQKWERITMIDALQKYVDIDIKRSSDQQLTDLLTKHQIKLIGEFSRGKAIFALFDKLVTSYLVQPTWVIDYPKEVSPLAKQHRLDPNMVERFEGYICGKEIADGWSELVCSVEQRRRFEEEQVRMRAGDDEAHPVDEDFIEAIEYGMPPLGGIGMGIDRLVMFLTNTWSIREVIAFPTLRPKQSDVANNQIANPIKNNISEHAVENNSLVNNCILPTREATQALLKKYMQNEALLCHSQMVAQAMEAYAKALGEDVELWYTTGLLHDLDWEKYPDEHPMKAVAEFLTDYPEKMKQAILAHAPGRTGAKAESLLARYLFACDELSGLMNAVSLMRPNGFADMEAKSVKKKIKDKSFAANVSREDIALGFELIGKTPEEHIGFLIEVFKNFN